MSGAERDTTPVTQPEGSDKITATEPRTEAEPAVSLMEPPTLPPEWVALSDLGKWFELHCGVSHSTMLRDFKLYLRGKPEHTDLNYRIGSPLGGLSGPGDNPSNRFSGGTKEAYFRGQRIAVVENWSGADDNFECVKAHGQWLPIFVLWADAERWCNQHVFLVDEPANASLPPPLAPQSEPTRRRGRRPKFNWEPASNAISAHLYANGLPGKGDGNQARLEKIAMDTFDPQNAPSESTVREHVAKLIRDLREAIEPKATKAGN